MGPEFATPSEARARILSDVKALSVDAVPYGWIVADGNEDKSFCEEFFRTGACPLRRCKHAHDVTISDLIGVPHGVATCSGPDAAAPGALPAMQRLPLCEIDAGGRMVYSRHLRRAVRQDPVLKFVDLEGRLVFDAANPSVFASHCARTAEVLAMQRASSAAATAGKEIQKRDSDAGRTDANDVFEPDLEDSGVSLI